MMGLIFCVAFTARFGVKTGSSLLLPVCLFVTFILFIARNETIITSCIYANIIGELQKKNKKYNHR